MMINRLLFLLVKASIKKVTEAWVPYFSPQLPPINDVQIRRKIDTSPAHVIGSHMKYRNITAATIKIVNKAIKTAIKNSSILVITWLSTVIHTPPHLRNVSINSFITSDWELYS